jgi:anion-transporting  ArsA/GET3 family ATPase
VRTLLADPATAYVVVTSPRPDAIEEATYFVTKLGDTDVSTAALVVNRVHPYFGSETQPAPTVSGDGPLADLVANLVQLNTAARDDERAIAGLVEQVAPAPVGRIALLESDVHDLKGLALVADRLFGDQPVR